MCGIHWTAIWNKCTIKSHFVSPEWPWYFQFWYSWSTLWIGLGRKESHWCNSRICKSLCSTVKLSVHAEIAQTLKEPSTFKKEHQKVYNKDNVYRLIFFLISSIHKCFLKFYQLITYSDLIKSYSFNFVFPIRCKNVLLDALSDFTRMHR